MRIRLRVTKGSLVPADEAARLALRSRKLKPGDIVHADVSKPRNPEFHRLVHQIGAMVVANVDEFKNLDAHEALKKLQLDANVQCEDSIMTVPDIGPCLIRTPKSLAFASMDEITFRDFAHRICRHIAERYWPDMTAEQVEQMAEMYVED